MGGTDVWRPGSVPIVLPDESVTWMRSGCGDMDVNPGPQGLPGVFQATHSDTLSQNKHMCSHKGKAGLRWLTFAVRNDDLP